MNTKKKEGKRTGDRTSKTGQETGMTEKKIHREQEGSKAVGEKGTDNSFGKHQAKNTAESGQGENMKGSGEIKEKLNAILRYRKKNYNLQSVWQVFVKIDDVLETPPMKELGAQAKAIKDAIDEDPNTIEKEIWKNEEYIRLVWNGESAGTQK